MEIDGNRWINHDKPWIAMGPIRNLMYDISQELRFLAETMAVMFEYWKLTYTERKSGSSKGNVDCDSARFCMSWHGFSITADFGVVLALLPCFIIFHYFASASLALKPRDLVAQRWIGQEDPKFFTGIGLFGQQRHTTSADKGAAWDECGLGFILF